MAENTHYFILTAQDFETDETLGVEVFELSREFKEAMYQINAQIRKKRKEEKNHE